MKFAAASWSAAAERSGDAALGMAQAKGKSLEVGKSPTIESGVAATAVQDGERWPGR
ncbi:MAG TPA: hypothetical protein VMA13_12345 [Candidatus Saccharimonadales bacterium]|nr:hypothetical protein [Candidatus Saccharimonadales bacterium]